MYKRRLELAVIFLAIMAAIALSLDAQAQIPYPTPGDEVIPQVEIIALEGCRDTKSYCLRRIMDHDYGLVCYTVLTAGGSSMSCVKIP